MSNNEFNYFKEENQFKENKSFDILSVNNKDKEVSSPKIDVYKTKEIGSSSKKVNKKDNKNVIKKILQKVTESTSSFVSGVAATAAVVITTVVIFSNVVFDKPAIELIELVEGYDYVEYNITLDDISEEISYYVVIDNSFESHSFDIRVGENKNVVNDLTSNSLYNLSVIGINNENQTEVKYFTTRFFTKESIENYKITWMSQGEILKEEQIQKGQIPSYDGVIPKKEETIDYKYEFIGWDQEFTEVFADTVYNAVFKEIEKEFTASINLLDESDAIIYWDNPDYNEVVFNVGFDNSNDPNLSYRIILTDESNNMYEYTGSSQNATINVPKDVSQVTITYELIIGYNGLEKVHSTKTMEQPLIFNNPTLSLGDSLTLSGVDEYELTYMINSEYYNNEQYKLINFDITYSDNTNEIIDISEFGINEVQTMKVKVPSFVSNMTIDYKLELLGNNGLNPRVVSGTKTYELTNEYYLTKKYVSNISSPSVILEFNYHFIDENTTIAVKDISTDEVTLLDANTNKITMYHDGSSQLKDYTYYLADFDGMIIDAEQSVSIDCTEQKGDYSFNYINPGDAIVTYNDDGTINIYLETVFETVDTNIYYSVVYNNYQTNKSVEVYYTSSYARYENVAFSDYGIVYYVYKNVDDIVYILEEIAVSGGIEITNDFNINGTITTEDDINYTITFSIEDYKYDFDENSFTLTIDGVNYVVDSSNLIYEATNGSYTFSYVIDFEPTNVEVTFQGSPSLNSYDTLVQNIDVKGNKYATITVSFY